MATRPKWYHPDMQLALRMLLTMFLLGVVYALFLLVLWWSGVPFLYLLVLAALILGIQFFFADKMALWSMRAREVTEEEVPELHALITRLAAQANLPKPRVAIVDTRLPNAFATGRSKHHAVVAVTTGLLEHLSTPEIEAVLAHELTHIINRDMMVMTIATFVSLVASLLTNTLLWGGFTGGTRGRRSRNQQESSVILSHLAESVLALVLSCLSSFEHI